MYQDVMLARHLSVGENFFLGKLPRTPLGLIDWKKIQQVTRKILEDLDLSIDPRMLVRHLPPAEQEMVTIAKAVYEESKLIVFDEPTALLTNEQVDRAFRPDQEAEGKKRWHHLHLPSAGGDLRHL